MTREQAYQILNKTQPSWLEQGGLFPRRREYQVNGLPRGMPEYFSTQPDPFEGDPLASGEPRPRVCTDLVNRELTITLAGLQSCGCVFLKSGPTFLTILNTSSLNGRYTTTGNEDGEASVSVEGLLVSACDTDCVNCGPLPFANTTVTTSCGLDSQDRLVIGLDVRVSTAYDDGNFNSILLYMFQGSALYGEPIYNQLTPGGCIINAVAPTQFEGPVGYDGVAYIV